MSSTNDYARELLDTYPYVFVSAQHQTMGRGRKGRVWEGGYGQNVYCSLGLRHTEVQTVEELSAYMARGAIAVLRALRRLAPGVQFSLKYPNDVLALKNHKWMKIGGILVEHEFQGDRCLSSVIGIGVNVLQESFPETIRDTGTSLHQHGINLDVSVVIDHVKWNITDLRTRPWREVHDEWVVELDIVGRTVRLAGDEGAWTVTKVLDDGRLAARNMVSSMERTISDGDTVRYLD